MEDKPRAIDASSRTSSGEPTTGGKTALCRDAPLTAIGRPKAR
jgi:hypothetical protein